MAEALYGDEKEEGEEEKFHGWCCAGTPLCCAGTPEQWYHTSDF